MEIKEEKQMSTDILRVGSSSELQAQTQQAVKQPWTPEEDAAILTAKNKVSEKYRLTLYALTHLLHLLLNYTSAQNNTVLLCVFYRGKTSGL